MISFECLYRRLRSIDKLFLVLCGVFVVVSVCINAVDGLSTTNERGMYSTQFDLTPKYPIEYDPMIGNESQICRRKLK